MKTGACPIPAPCALFAWLISHQPTVLFYQNKPATSNQPTVLFSQNKPAPAINHQPNAAKPVLSSRPKNEKFIGPKTRTFY
jgi:hypothetical protein